MMLNNRPRWVFVYHHITITGAITPMKIHALSKNKAKNKVVEQFRRWNLNPPNNKYLDLTIRKVSLTFGGSYPALEAFPPSAFALNPRHLKPTQLLKD